MKQPTIGAVIICKNNREELQRLLPQLRRFDQVVVMDTGSTDKTANYIRKLGRPFELYSIKWRMSPVDEDTGEAYGPNDWGFAYARNASFSVVKTDYAIWLDSDDVIGRVVNGTEISLSPEAAVACLRKLVEDQPDLDHWLIDYIYGHDVEGNQSAVQTRERLLNMKKGKWNWVYPIHEIVLPDHPPQYAKVSDVKIIHLPTTSVGRSATRNMSYLEKWYDQLIALDPEHPDLGRCRHLLAKQCMGLEQLEESIKWHHEFLDKHPNVSDIDKWQAWSLIGKCHLARNSLSEAAVAYAECLKIRPDLPDGYFGLAKIKLREEAPPMQITTLLDWGARCEDPPKEFVIFDPMDYTFEPYLINSQIQLRMGNYDAALKFANMALVLRPQDATAIKCRVDAALKVRSRDAKAAALALYEILHDFDENEKANAFAQCLPYVITEDEEIRLAATKARDRVRHMVDSEAYEKKYQENPGWVAVPEEWLLEGHTLAQIRYDYTLDRLKKMGAKRILDVGCSDGFHSLLLAKAGFEVVGVDLDQRCVDVANERAQKWDLPAKFIHGFFEKMDPETTVDPFDGEPWVKHFDAVICGEVIEHVQNPLYLIGSLLDCAKDNGPVLISTPNGAFELGERPAGDDLGLSNHIRAYTQETFEYTLMSVPEAFVTESHFLSAQNPAAPAQGWQVGEIRRTAPPEGPRIRIFCGEPAEAFTPENLIKGGIGGSETAVLEMAKWWTRMGCRVVVYGKAVGVWDGIFFRHHTDFSPDKACELFVAWRTPYIFQYGRPKADRTVLWLHDIRAAGYDIPQEHADAIDQVAVVSKFHGQTIAKEQPLLKDKIWVTRNGIEPLRYLHLDKVKKVPHRYFYSSSADRGLEQLLEIWPSVREKIPDAELHVCYGFESPMKISKMIGNMENYKFFERLLDKVENTPGVVHHGRLNQIDLAKLQMTCEAWLYPWQPGGGFLETACITKFEAMAAGAVPLTRLNGALPERLPHCIEWTGEMTVDNVVEILLHLNDHWRQEWTKENREYAMQEYRWESLAREWIGKFAEDVGLDAEIKAGNLGAVQV